MLTHFVLQRCSFEMLAAARTDVLLLAPGGRTVFCGSAAEAAAHFDALGLRCPPQVNPADHWLDLIAGRVGNDKVSACMHHLHALAHTSAEAVAQFDALGMR